MATRASLLAVGAVWNNLPILIYDSPQNFSRGGKLMLLDFNETV